MGFSLKDLLSSAVNNINNEVVLPIHNVEAGLIRQVNPFDNGKTYSNPIGNQGGTGTGVNFPIPIHGNAPTTFSGIPYPQSPQVVPSSQPLRDRLQPASAMVPLAKLLQQSSHPLQVQGRNTPDYSGNSINDYLLPHVPYMQESNFKFLTKQ